MATLYRHAVRWAMVPMLAFGTLASTGCIDRNRTPPSRIYYHGPQSDHFDGSRFFNPEGEDGSGGAKRNGIGAFLRIAEGRSGDHTWPKSVPVVQTAPPQRVEGERMLVTWIGHATALVQTQGINILVDPVWASRDAPVQFLGPRRVREPGLKLNDLPPIDLILISHNHYDHLDIDVLKKLSKRDDPTIITGLGNDTLLKKHGLQSTAGDWGQTIQFRPGVEIEIMPVHHWSEHWYNDIDRALWCGFRVKLNSGDLYFAGDTGAGKMVWAKTAAKDDRPIRLAVLPIAPYKLTTPQTGNHMDPDQAVEAFGILRPAYALGVHWGTFELGQEAIDDAPLRLEASLRRQGIDSHRFRTIGVGQSWDIPTIEK